MLSHSFASCICWPFWTGQFPTRLVIMVVAKYASSVNIANANVFGLSKELHMEDGNKYNTALVIFFVPYILFEIPSNILLKKLKPRVWLSLCMFGFGLGKHT